MAGQNAIEIKYKVKIKNANSARQNLHCLSENESKGAWVEASASIKGTERTEEDMSGWQDQMSWYPRLSPLSQWSESMVATTTKEGDGAVGEVGETRPPPPPSRDSVSRNCSRKLSDSSSVDGSSSLIGQKENGQERKDIKKGREAKVPPTPPLTMVTEWKICMAIVQAMIRKEWLGEKTLTLRVVKEWPNLDKSRVRETRACKRDDSGQDKKQ